MEIFGGNEDPREEEGRGIRVFFSLPLVRMQPIEGTDELKARQERDLKLR